MSAFRVYLGVSLIASGLLLLWLVVRDRLRYGLFGHTTTLLDSCRQDTSLRRMTPLQEARWRVRANAGRLVCLVRGSCDFNTHSFHSNCLYFCTRCDRELTGRTFADLVPLTDDEREEFDRDLDRDREWEHE